MHEAKSPLTHFRLKESARAAVVAGHAQCRAAQVMCVTQQVVLQGSQVCLCMAAEARSEAQA